jgi:O-antigen/teichoic acid export membrane protein
MAIDLSGFAEMRDQLRGRSVVWALLVPAALLGLSLATYSIASRLLTQAEFASFAVAIAALSTLVPFVSLGTPVVLVRHMAGERDSEGSRLWRAGAYLVILLAGAALLVLASGLALLAGRQVAWWVTPILWPILAVGAAAAALTDLRMSVYQAAFEFRRQFLGLASAALGRVAGVYLAIRFVPEPNHGAAVAGYAAASVLAAVFMLRLDLVRAFRHTREALALMRHDLLLVGLPVTVSSLLAVLTTQIDTLVAKAFLDPADLAQYAAASRLSLVHSTIIGGLTAVALPVAASLARRGSLGRYARMSTVLGLSLGVLAMAVSYLIGPAAIAGLFGRAYAPSLPLFLVLSAGFVLNYAGNPISQVLYMTGRANVMVIVQAAQLVAFVAAAIVLAPRSGATGLAMARSATNVIAVAVIGGLSLAAAGRHAPAGRPVVEP